MFKRIIAIGMAAILAVGALNYSAFAASEHKTQGLDAKQELNIGLVSDPSTFDFQKAAPVIETEIYDWCMEGLTRSDGVNSVKPGIAERWTCSPNGKVWTFYLRDAVWSDGKAVTAQDFVTGVLRILDPEYKASRKYLLWDIKGAYEYSEEKKSKDGVGVRAIDDKTIQFTLDYPVAYFDTLVAMPGFSPIRKDVLERNGGEWNSNIENMVTDGPFLIKSRTEGDRITFEKNKKYWDEKSIKLEKVNALVLSDADSERELFDGNKVDVMLNYYGERDSLIKDAERKSYHDGTICFLSFNCEDKIMKNKNIRKAVSLAINRSKLIKSATNFESIPALSIVNPEIIRDLPGKDFRSQKPFFFKDEDINLAKSYLAKGLKELKLKKCPEIGIVLSDTDEHKAVTQSMEEDLMNNLGVKLNTTLLPSDAVSDRKAAHKFQMTLSYWWPDYPDASGVLYMFKSDSSSNDGKYKNKAFDKLARAAEDSMLVEQRSKLQHEAEQIVMEDMPISPLYYNYVSYTVKPYVKNLTRGAFGPDLNIVYAYIEGKK